MFSSYFCKVRRLWMLASSAKIDGFSTKITSQLVGPSQSIFHKIGRTMAFTATTSKFRENHGYPLVVFTKSRPKSRFLV